MEQKKAGVLLKPRVYWERSERKLNSSKTEESLLLPKFKRR
jgi:hypothetical protein